ncbi:hypothetical protein [Brevibacterium renqingii]|uniref:hypothetical protein n=1 Tax=Brevibacterium renqingii TaxID=2776916 RepID=UPI001AE0ADE0|nr:hypothetical protein [Brevibacterium renqingii]
MLMIPPAMTMVPRRNETVGESVNRPIGCLRSVLDAGLISAESIGSAASAI